MSAQTRGLIVTSDSKTIKTFTDDISSNVNLNLGSGYNTAGSTSYPIQLSHLTSGDGEQKAVTIKNGLFGIDVSNNGPMAKLHIGKEYFGKESVRRTDTTTSTNNPASIINIHTCHASNDDHNYFKIAQITSSQNNKCYGGLNIKGTIIGDTFDESGAEFTENFMRFDITIMVAHTVTTDGNEPQMYMIGTVNGSAMVIDDTTPNVCVKNDIIVSTDTDPNNNSPYNIYPKAVVLCLKKNNICNIEITSTGYTDRTNNDADCFNIDYDGIRSGTNIIQAYGLWQNDNLLRLSDPAKNDIIYNTPNGVGIGTNVPKSNLDVSGCVTIGSGYTGTDAAPTDGMLVEGNVGIGTNSPQSKLDVEGSVAIGSAYSGNTAAPSNGMIVEGNVGIGTNAPGTKKLDVRLETTTTTDSTASFGLAKNVEGNSIVTISNAWNGSSLTKDGDAVLSLTPFKKVSGNVEGRNSYIASVPTTYTGDDSTRRADIIFKFRTIGGEGSNNTYTSAAEIMRIRADGHVGIGTNDPKTTLQINGTDALRIPVGTFAQRPSDLLGGQIRYNTTNSQFEGYDGNYWETLNGVSNYIGNTKITASSPDADSTNNDLIFYTSLTNYTSGPLYIQSDGAGWAQDHLMASAADSPNGLAGIINEGQQQNLSPETSGNGSGAKLTIDTSSGGGTSGPIVSVTVTNGGSGYQVGDTLTVPNIQIGGRSDDLIFILTADNINATPTPNGPAVERMRIDASGNVGIGTNIPSEKLDVNGKIHTKNSAIDAWYNNICTVGHKDMISDTNGYALHQSSEGRTALNAPTNEFVDLRINNDTKFRLVTNGNIGIGTTAPQSKLDVEGSVRIGSSYAGNNSITADPPEGMIVEGNVGIGTNAPKTKLQIGDEIAGHGGNSTYETDALMVINQTESTGSDSSNPIDNPKDVLYLARQAVAGVHGSMARFKLCKYETTTTNSRTRMDINLTHGAFDDVNIMSLRSDGNVGIGTNTPTEKLQVNGNIDISGSGVLKMDGVELIRNNNDNTNHDFYYNCRVIRNLTQGPSAGMYINYGSPGTDPDCRFYAGGGNNPNQRMIIKANGGQVGIGTDDPTEKLEVDDGNVLVNGKFHSYKKGSLTTVVNALLDSTNSILTDDITAGTYSNLATSTNGSGSGATITVVAKTVSSVGTITSVTIKLSGIGYAVGDTLTVASNLLPNRTTDLVFTLTIKDFENYMIIDKDNGKVGIGISKPVEKLHVYGNSYIRGNLYVGAGDTKDWISYFTKDTWTGPINTNLNINSRANSNDEGIAFRMNAQSATPEDTTKMFLSRSGKLQIGQVGWGSVTDANSITSDRYIEPVVTLDICGNDALRIPVGTTTQRPIAASVIDQTDIAKYIGSIRYNSENSQFEGYGPGNAWGSLGGVINVAQNTKIIAESSPAATNNQLQFFTAPKVGSLNTTNNHFKSRINTLTETITAGTYTLLPITGGSGSGAKVQINAVVNNITGFQVTNGGSGYIKGDVLTITAADFIAKNSGRTTDLVFTLTTDGDNSGDDVYLDPSVNTDGTMAERMRIDSNGNVGIGTTDPKTKLQIDSTDALRIPVGDTSERPSSTTLLPGQIRYNSEIYQFEGYGPGSSWGSLGGVINVAQNTKIIASSPDADSTNNQLQFFTATSGDTTTAAATERMRIDSNGNVGIGTTAPQSKLDVEGSVRIGSTYAGDTSITTDPPEGMIVEGNVGIGTYDPTARLHVNHGNNNLEKNITAMDIFKNFNGIEVANSNTYAGRIYGTDSSIGETGIRVCEKNGNNGLNSNSSKVLDVYSDGSSKMVVTGAGNVGIGLVNVATYNPTASPKETLHVKGAILVEAINYAASEQGQPYLIAGTQQHIEGNTDTTHWGTFGFQHRFKSNSGGSSRITVDTRYGEKYSMNEGGDVTATSYNATSDMRHKENITDLDNSLEKIKAIRGVNFNFKNDDKIHSGIIAQEVAEIIPEAICKRNDEKWTANYNTFIGYLIESVKTLSKENDELKEDIKQKGDTIDKLQDDVSAIKEMLNIK